MVAVADLLHATTDVIGIIIFPLFRPPYAPCLRFLCRALLSSFRSFAQFSYCYFAGLLGAVMTIVTAAMAGAPPLPDAARLLAAAAAGPGLPTAAAAAAAETGPPLEEGIREEAGAGLLLRVIGRPAPVLLEIDDWTNPASSTEEEACSHSPSSGHQHCLVRRVVLPLKSVT
jgi:hypothetical protein